MKINRENCEAWFLDYYEGNLSKTEEQELFAFLVLHPDLREKFDSFEDVSFDTDKDLHFDGKEELKKFALLPAEITQANCEEFFIAAAEGLLSENEKTLLEKFLAENPQKKTDYELFRKTLLHPDDAIVFEYKTSLKKTISVTPENFAEFAVAAMDGELDEASLKIFNAFVAAHPERKKELELVLKTKLHPGEKVVFENKKALKKPAVSVTEDQFEEWCSAFVDGTLSAEEKNAFTAFVAAHPGKEKIFSLYRKTKLQPDTAVVFSDKASLKKGEKDRGAFWLFTDLRFAAAAAVVLLIGILWWANRDVSVKNIPANPLANNHATDSAQQLAGTNKTKNPDSLLQPKNISTNPSNKQQQLANTNAKNRITPPKNFRIKKALNNLQIARITPPKNFRNKNKNDDQHIARITPPKNFIVNDGSPVVAMNSRDAGSLQTSAVAQDVDFSGSLFDDETYVTAQNTSSQPLSFGQYVMRRTKHWLDHKPAGDNTDDQQLAYAAMADQKKNNGNVTGFDLTSSVVNRVGEATGTNVHLGKDAAGTSLSIGKYKMYLSKN